MSQRRTGVILGGVILALAAVSAPVQAQGPQRGGGGGQRGGFTGGRGGFGGRSGALVDLAGREVIQKEIQVTDEQKPQIESLAQETRSRRDRTTQQLRQRNDRARSQVQNARPNLPPVANTPANSGGAYGGAYGGGDIGGFGTSAFGGNAPPQGPSPAQLQQMAEQQQQQQERMVRMQGFEQMRQAVDGIRHQSDQALAKILKKEQMTRLREIQLQMEGPFAILSNAELAQRLSITPQQALEIRDVQAKDRERQTQTAQQTRAVFEAIRNSAQPNAGTQANAGTQQAGARPNAGAQPNAGGQQGNRGGRGNFDREAFREMMQKPEVQAQLDQIQERREGLRQLAYAGVFKALDRRQSSTYKKMLGEPFDTSAMMRSFFDRQRGDSEQAANAANDDDDAPTTKPAAPDSATAPAPAAESAPAPAAGSAPAPASTNRRSSLRERRGLGASPQP